MRNLFATSSNFTGHKDNMAKIRLIHEKLDFSQLQKETGEIRELKAGDGMAFVVTLLDSKEIGIVRCSATKGAALESHQHDALEVIILYEGAMDLIFDDKVVQLNAEKRTHYILPNVRHAAKFTKDSKTIGITVPSSYR